MSKSIRCLLVLVSILSAAGCDRNDEEVGVGTTVETSSPTEVMATAQGLIDHEQYQEALKALAPLSPGPEVVRLREKAAREAASKSHLQRACMEIDSQNIESVRRECQDDCDVRRASGGSHRRRRAAPRRDQDGPDGKRGSAPTPP